MTRLRPITLVLLILGMSITGVASASSPRLKLRAATKRDPNFGCELPEKATKAWRPRGYPIPKGVAQKFRYWKSAETRDAVFGECPALPAKYIIRQAGGGNVSRFDLVVAQEGVRVHRAFSEGPFICSDKSPGQRFGVWWSFDEPKVKARFRERNAVCPEWNDMSMKISCVLKAGTVVAVGPTQSAQCNTEQTPECPQRPASWAAEYKATTQHQVYLNLFNRSESDIKKFLTNCRVTPWPDPE